MASELDHAREAVAVVYSFWQALARDDDAALPQCVFHGYLHRLGWPGPGIATLLRQLFGLGPDQCERMGVTNIVRWVPDVGRPLGLVVLSIQPDGLRGVQIFGLDGPEEIVAWPLLTQPTREDGKRRIWGVPPEDWQDHVREYITIPIEIEATGPMN